MLRTTAQITHRLLPLCSSCAKTCYQLDWRLRSRSQSVALRLFMGPSCWPMQVRRAEQYAGLCASRLLALLHSALGYAQNECPSCTSRLGEACATSSCVLCSRPYLPMRRSYNMRNTELMDPRADCRCYVYTATYSSRTKPRLVF
jgi:hypothetical protein